MALTPEKKRQLDEIYAREGVEGIQKLRASLEEEEEKPGFLKQLGQFAIKGAVEGTKLAEFIGRSIPGGGKDKWDPQRHERLPELLQKTTYSPEEVERRMGGATAGERFGSGFELGTKGAAGVASYLAPFAAPVVAGPSAVSTIAPQASDILLKMLNVGVAGGFQAGAREYSEEETTPGKVVGQAGVGALTAAATVPAGEALKATGKFIGKKLTESGIAAKYNAIKKLLGRFPTKKQGGTELLGQMDEVGIKTSSVDDLLGSSQEILDQNKPIMSEGLKKLGEVPFEEMKGSGDEIIKVLDDAIDSVQAEDLKAPLRVVREKIKNDLMTIEDWNSLYELKQNYGKLSNWEFGGEVTKNQALGYRKVYMKLNEIMDDSLKAAGETRLLEINKSSHIAIKALQYVNDSIGKGSIYKGGGLTDIAALGTGFVTGGFPGAIKAYALKKLLTSSTAKRIGGSVLEKAGDVAGKGLVGKAVQSPVVRGGITSLSQFLTGGR